MHNNQLLFDTEIPLVMGIINLTPDSFYYGNRFAADEKLLAKIENMLDNGADIIDFGGYSTRPGAEFINSDEEIERLTAGLEIVLKKFPDILVSIDTFRADVAENMVKNFGVKIINDIGGGTLDSKMFDTIAKLKVAYILMHTRGNPQNMKFLTDYQNVTTEVFDFLQKNIAQLRNLGVENIIADLGFGFAKNTEQNYELLANLPLFKELNVPLLVGVSRKSMISNILKTEPADSLNGTTVVNTIALINGANILRVHDVKEARQAIAIYLRYKNYNN